MTPTAIIPARRKKQSSPNGAGTPPTAHRRSLRRSPAPAAPRRISGPAGGRGTQAGSKRSRAATRTAPPAPFLAGARTFLRSLPDHAVIDRLVRGRAWIPALGVMLAGIVAMQVEVLKLGASIGRSVQRTALLSARNAQLQDSVASLADDQRIERVAAGMGMVMSPPASVGFLSASRDARVRAAIANLRAPNATTFLNSSATNGFVVTPTSLAAANASAGSAATGTSSSATTSTSPAAVAPATTSGSSPTYSPPSAPASTGGTSAGATAVTPATATSPATSTSTAAGSTTPSNTPTGAAALAPASGTTTPTGG